MRLNIILRTYRYAVKKVAGKGIRVDKIITYTGRRYLQQVVITGTLSMARFEVVLSICRF